MFHQNSNDLVKNASVRSGHIQNSSGTREMMMKDLPSGPLNAGDDDTSASASAGEDRGANASLSIGAKFQNMIQGLIDSVSLKEGLAGPGGPAGPAGPAAAGGYSGADVDRTKKENDEWTQQQLDHIERSDNIMKLIDKADKNTRKQWVEVTDSAGVTKYGYITKDGIFQIWSAPASPISTGWFQTDKMKQNSNVLGCPAATGSIKKHKIAGTWETMKPFDMVYESDDSGRKNPLFLLVNDAVRDPKNSVRGMGLFSCDNERGNVYVGQRPSADFKITTDGEVGAVQMGCYVIADKVKDSDLTNRGFTFQTDLTEASISQCKRRAEDLGSSYFLVSSPPDENKPKNRGGCWIYTGSGNPNINGILTIDEKGGKCHKVGNVEGDEDEYMKAYTPSNLPRLYGKDATVEIPINPPNPTCDHTTRNGCIFNSYQHRGNGACYPPNGSGSWAYGGLYTYNKQQLKEWLNALHSRNGDGIERGAVNEYIERCKNTKGYEFLDPTPSPPRTKIERSVALYSLKRGGPTGVDTIDRNGRGYIGRIAYIDHNGERHQYPASALSFMAPSKNAAGETQPASYVNLGGYDTRSAESSYALKEITPGSFSEASNLLYKASRDGWSPAAFHQRCDNKGATYTRAIINDGRVLGAYTSLSWSSTVQNYQSDTTAFLYDGTTKFPAANGASTPGMYATAMNQTSHPTFGGGHDMSISGRGMYTYGYSFISSDGKAPFGRQKYTREDYTLQDIEVYSVDANTFPKTNPPDYARRLRTMPVGESITASMEKCRGMCDADEKCGGFVYTKSGNSADGKCELKDRAKMYPVGLRVADQTKQLMLKVPTINGTIADDKCKVGNGAYTIIDSAHYAHYPDTGAMTAGTKCDVKNLIPKKGSLEAPDLTAMFGARDAEFAETQDKIDEYRAQTTVSESFTGLREGMRADISGGNYADSMKDIQRDLTKIANSEYQRERLLAITEETNKVLISESYKFILWSILAILAVMALLKLKEMFGQDDVDAGDGGDGSGGLFAYILGLFGVGSVKTDDIADRTGDVKEALSSAGAQLKEAGEKLTTDITEGADNLVSSANEAAAGAVEGAKGLADKVSETATDAVNKVGDAVGSAGATAPTPSGAATGAGTGGRARISRKK
jgi:hypothetical protein